jgi:hypothetical protein
MGDRVFISYLNDDNKQVSGYVELVEKTESHLTFKTNGNKITISYNRLLKLKEADQ